MTCAGYFVLTLCAFVVLNFLLVTWAAAFVASDRGGVIGLSIDPACIEPLAGRAFLFRHDAHGSLVAVDQSDVADVAHGAGYAA